MIVIKVLVQRIIISLTSDLTVYAPQCGLDDSQKDFHDRSYQCGLKVSGDKNFNYSRTI